MIVKVILPGNIIATRAKLHKSSAVAEDADGNVIRVSTFVCLYADQASLDADKPCESNYGVTVNNPTGYNGTLASIAEQIKNELTEE